MRELEAKVFRDLVLNLDDLESADVPESVRENITQERLQEVADTASDLLYSKYHEAVAEACKRHVLVEINPDGLHISAIKEKTYVNILTQLKVDPADSYEVGIYKAAQLIQSKHPYRGLIYRTSHTNSSVWSTPDESYSVRVWPWEGRIEE